jgi:hypothetical protein
MEEQKALWMYFKFAGVFGGMRIPENRSTFKFCSVLL